MPEGFLYSRSHHTSDLSEELGQIWTMQTAVHITRPLPPQFRYIAAISRHTDLRYFLPRLLSMSAARHGVKTIPDGLDINALGCSLSKR